MFRKPPKIPPARPPKIATASPSPQKSAMFSGSAVAATGALRVSVCDDVEKHREHRDVLNPVRYSLVLASVEK